MIEVRNLVKTFKSRGEKKTKINAIDNMSFCVEKKGMVFILGKSGSGKSTLLNILGGLDTATSGEVYINGTNIENLSKKGLNQYRALNISFIFQDHHLINSLTVYENIVLSLNAVNKTDDGYVDELLKRVDLYDSKNKYPYELSGGMRQRAAVCRALVKNPDIILCDEPTGNLDDATAKLVLDLLKELSSEKLILIVSHNIVDAVQYADRIIEIFNGKIINDTTKAEDITEGLEIKNNIIYLPQRVLKKEELEELNSINEVKKFRLKTDAFVNTKIKPHDDNTSISLDNTSFYRRKYLRLMGIIIKKGIKNTLISALIIALLIGCFSMFQSLLHFDSNQAVIDSLNSSNKEEVVLRNNYYKDSIDRTTYNKIAPMSKSDFDKVANCGLNGDIFPIYNYSTHYDSNDSVLFEHMSEANRFGTRFYPGSTLGTIQCNEEFLKKKFAIDGKLEYVGDIYNKVGVIITDFIADYLIQSINDTSYKTYESLIGPTYFSKNNQVVGVISAIIMTNYKELHKDAYNSYIDDSIVVPNYYADEKYLTFNEDVRNRLAYNYYVMGDFMAENSYIMQHTATDVIDSQKTSFLPFNNFELICEAGTGDIPSVNLLVNGSLQSGEIAIPISVYNSLFKTNHTRDNTSKFEPKTIKIIKRYNSIDSGSPIFFEKELKIVNIYDMGGSQFFISSDDFKDFFEHSIINFSFMLTDFNDVNKVIDLFGDSYIVENTDTTSIVKVNIILELYSKICQFVEIILLALCILCIIFFCINNIKDNKHDIGIMKSLGIKDTNINIIIFAQNCLMGILIVILANIASYIFTGIGNSLIINALKDLTETYIYRLVIIQYYPALIVVDLAFALGLIFISSIVPLILLSRFKPIEIMKAKE